MLEHKREARGIAEQSSAVSVPRVTVVYTFAERTLAVCRQTARLVEQLGMTIRILVPLVVPYSLAIERPAVDREFVARAIVQACAGTGVDVRVDVCLCRDRLECVRRELESQSIVVLTRPRRWAWGERRLERTLRQDGHRVVSL
jgi:hypothetical protein